MLLKYICHSHGVRQPRELIIHIAFVHVQNSQVILLQHAFRRRLVLHTIYTMICSYSLSHRAPIGA